MKTQSSQRSNLVRSIDFTGVSGEKARRLLDNQWLVTNGLGGYASGTIAGAVTWRYHGLLIAALPAPLGRTLMLNHLAESVQLSGEVPIQFSGGDQPGQEDSAVYLTEFRLEDQLPTWYYNINGVVIEKRVLMLYLQNTTHVTYTLKSKHSGIRLELRPSVHFRPFEGNVGAGLSSNYEVRVRGTEFEIHSGEDYPCLRLFIDGQAARFTNDGGSVREIFYERDAERGYEARGALWTPGYFSVPLTTGAPTTLIASTEDWRTISALNPDSALVTECDRRKRLLRLAHPKAHDGIAAELVLAADQFIITPAGRIADAARARASGDEIRSVIAGYHWFTDWGRDTMISLEGLTVTTGRFHEAAWILRTFAHYVRDGLIPNMFPEGRNEGLYHTADATLWFFQALHRYTRATNDRETLVALLPTLRSIVEYHLRGTHYGIRVDPADGLLHQGQEGYQLTWMDAKVADWVVTPRRGKAVEINALWYNALRLLESWLEEEGEIAASKAVREQADRVRECFNKRFWNPNLKCLFDVIDGEKEDDPAIRPNQILAISLTHPVLAREHWETVLDVVREKLLTPVGLRSLSREHSDYKSKYFGDLRSRDAAYHQGTVWAWLIGPFIDAWLKVYPDRREEARHFLDGFAAHLNEGCVGSISEVFDAEAPYIQRGCIAQAWSVAEVLRTLVLTSENPA